MSDSQRVISGHKVKLQPFELSDIDVRYLSWLNDSEVVRFSNQRFLKHDVVSSQRYLATFEGTENKFMSIRRLSDGLQIGTLTGYLLPFHGTADVGIMIGDKTLWGGGYGQDAWDTFTRWLFESCNIRKLTAGTLACNHGMIKIMERSGMVLEAVRKKQEIVDGQTQDMLYYAKFCCD